jgi:hypothetical protein
MIECVNKIYDCCKTCSIFVHEVHDPKIYEFSRLIKKFDKFLFTTQQYDTWREFIGRLKRYRFIISSSPLPPNSKHLDLNNAIAWLKTSADQRLAHNNENEVNKIIKSLLDSFYSVSEMESSRIGLKFNELLNANPSSNNAAVLLDYDLVLAMKKYAYKNDSLEDLHIISPNELRGKRCYDCIFIFGSPGWYTAKGSAFLFTAPRSSRIDLISYSWIDNNVKIKPLFECPQPPCMGKEKPEKIKVTRSVEVKAQDIEKEDFSYLPVIDIDRLKTRLNKLDIADGAEDPEDMVDAKIVILAGNKAVFVEFTDTASSLIINISKDDNDTDDEENNREEDDEVDVDDVHAVGSDRVERDSNGNTLIRKRNVDLEEGMFILLRTAGGGDYIVPVADKILADQKDKCRNMQHKWKSLFKIFLINNSASRVRKKIKELGGSDVSETTLRNWTRERNIQPGNPRNFDAVLNLIGLSVEAGAYRNNADMILQAHRKAGGFIRNLLLEQIRSKKREMEKLVNEGTMVFNLTRIDTAASMTAFRIDNILQETHRVHHYRVGHPVDLGDDRWR